MIFFDITLSLTTFGAFSSIYLSSYTLFLFATPYGLDLAVLSGNFIWNDWFAPYFAYIHDNADIIRAVAYINVDWDSQSIWANQGWDDSRIQTNAIVMERWLAEIQGDFWLNTSPDLFSLLHYPEDDES